MFRLQFILDSAAVCYRGFTKFLETKEQNSSSSLFSLREIAAGLVGRMGVNLEETPSFHRLWDEMELFLTTGDFEPKTFKVVCLNPTLLTSDDKLWQVNIENLKKNKTFLVSHLKPRIIPVLFELLFFRFLFLLIHQTPISHFR